MTKDAAIKLAKKLSKDNPDKTVITFTIDSGPGRTWGADFESYIDDPEADAFDLQIQLFYENGAAVC